MGLFAGSGVGKRTLLSMMARHSHVDAVVVLEERREAGARGHRRLCARSPPVLDDALRCASGMEMFLRQGSNDYVSFTESVAALQRAVNPPLA